MVQEIISGFIRGAINIGSSQYEERELKQLRKGRSGIYCIENKVTGDKYVGKSYDVAKRLQTHITQLRNNKHYYRNNKTSIIQRAWNKYGEKSFRTYILCYCSKDELNEKEIYWIERLKTNREKYNQGYNLTAGGEGTSHISPNKGKIQMNNGEIQKLVKLEEVDEYLKRGFVKGILPATREKIIKNTTILSGKDSPFYGKKQNPEVVKKRGEAIKKVKAQKDCSHSEETKRKISETFRIKREKGIKHNCKRKKVYKYNLNNNLIEVYESVTEAGKKNNITTTTISRWCNKGTPKKEKYIWRFGDDS